MSIVNDLKDEWQGLSNARLPWEKYWRNIAAYVLPQTEGFDRLLTNNKDLAITSVVSTPVAANKSKNIYDMTSLWGIERLTAGMISLKTPETEAWHLLGLDSYFGEEPSYDEEVALEKLRNYLFKVRANPRSGFWSAHRSAVKSMCAFGDGWMQILDRPGADARTPYAYQWAPLAELYPAVGTDGQPNRMYRISSWSAIQIATKWQERAGSKVLEMANDPKRMHDVLRVMQGVRPRSDDRRVHAGVRGAQFESHYALPDENHHIGEGGYYEFPFTRYAWSNTNNRPFSEGPVAYALGEIKSLQEMGKNELLAIQSVMRPAYAVRGKNMTRLNLNPGVANPGLISGDGKPLFAPMTTGVRPDFAAEVMRNRRESVREMLYLNLWQIILQDKNDTATEALIRAQEKGELLGPVGISMNEGLSHMVDREVSILSRARAFAPGSPLEMPETMNDKGVAPEFNSPLDRLRRMGELVGMQRLVEFSTLLEQLKPGTAARVDADEMLDTAREVLGAPVKSLRDREDADADRAQGAQMQQMAAALESLKSGGDAAKSVGEGAAAMAAGSEQATQSGALQRLLQQGAPAGAAAASRNAA